MEDDETHKEPYAVLSEDNITLTFYYDENKEAKGGMDVGPFTSLNPEYNHENMVKYL